MADWSKIGRSSREKGARFERKCREIMLQIADASEQDHGTELVDIQWRRTQAGQEQMYGDLIPISVDGHREKLDGRYTYVECKYRKKISWTEIKNFRKLLMEGYDGWWWFLIIGQPLGPVYVFTNYKVPVEENILGPCHIIV